MATQLRAFLAKGSLNSTTQVFTKPTSPGTVVSGDMMLIFLIVNGSTAPSSTPSGFTLAESIVAALDVSLYVYAKVAGGSEPADYTFTWASSIIVAGGMVVGYSDTALTLVIDDTNKQTNASGDRIWAAVAPGVANSLVAWFAFVGANTGTTPPGGSDERWDTGSFRNYCMTELVAASGSTGTRTGTGTSASSKTISIAISETPATPGDPSDLSATAISTTQIDLAWTDNATTETAYSVERSPTGAGSWVEIATPAANATSYSDTGLTPATQYFYRVRANNAGVYSGYSNTADATTDTPAPDQAPYNMTAQAWTASRIDLAWEHNGVNTDGYSIERSTSEFSGFVEIDTTPDLFYSDTGLASNTTYYYRVRAYNT